MTDKLKSGINIGQNIRVQRSAEVKELVDGHGKKRICSRCPQYAVQRVKSEWLCPTCLHKREARQKQTAEQTKCGCGNVVAASNFNYCGACLTLKEDTQEWLAKLEAIKNLDEMKEFLADVLKEMELI